MKRTVWLSALLITIFVVLFVFARLTATKDGGFQATIRIGVILPLTGHDADLGESMRRGYEWRIEELNKEGKNVQLVVEDSKSNLADGVIAFVKLGDMDVMSHTSIVNYNEYATTTADAAFIRDYRVRFNGDPSLLTGIAYTDVEIIMSAIEQSGTIDAMQVFRYIKGLRSFKGKYEAVNITSNGEVIILRDVRKQ